MAFDHRGKIHVLSTFCSFKNKLQTFDYFSRLVSIFKTFSKSRKLLGKFQAVFKNSRLCPNPVSSRVEGFTQTGPSHKLKKPWMDLSP